MWRTQGVGYRQNRNLATRASDTAPTTARAHHGAPSAAAVGCLLGFVLAALAGGELIFSSTSALGILSWIEFAAAVILAGVLVGQYRRVLEQRGRLRELEGSLEHSAQTDPLTGLLNDAALHEQLVRAAAHARRRVEPVSALVVNLCHLGEINDRFGHGAGDEVLRAFAGCMRTTLRADDVYGRLGEDEFLVLLPGTIRVQAEIVAERLQGLAAEIDIPGVQLPHGVELCVGCATAVRATPDGIMDVAREELVRARAQRPATA